MRRANSVLALAPRLAVAVVALLGTECDNEREKEADKAHDAAPPASETAGSSVGRDAPRDAGGGGALDASSGRARAAEWDGSMPPRPVPRTSPTVGAGMPMETQMRAVAYMTAMGQPRDDDAPADPQYAALLAAQLRPIAFSLDHGSTDDKAKLDRVEVVGSGRRIDLLLAAGCDAETPMRAVVTRANVPLSTLRSHGVLVVRCNDARTQCLQSTRDPGDVLCTTAPRHK